MLILRTLTTNDENAFFEAVRAWTEKERDWITFDWKPGISFADHLAKLNRDNLGIGLGEGKVPHTMLYAFVSGKIVGRVSVRHKLTETLRQRGGHVGYSVNPKDRRMGHASKMFSEALAYCAKLGIDKILVTCSDTNEPSYKIIEKSGGVLENKTWDPKEQTFIRRYWVQTT